MYFVDVVIGQTNGNNFTTKILVGENDLLIDVIKTAISEMLACMKTENNGEGMEGENADDMLERAVRGVVDRVKSIKCGDCELFKFLSTSGAFVQQLESSQTPISSKGLVVKVMAQQTTENTATTMLLVKQKLCMSDVLMKRAPEMIKFLCYDAVTNPHVDRQIKEHLIDLFEEEGLGYCDHFQKKLLETNIQKIQNVLCAVESNWRPLLNADFPHIPSGGFESSKLLLAVAKTNRLSKSKAKTFGLEKIVGHIGALSSVRWKEYKSTKLFNDSIIFINNEMSLLGRLLRDYKSKLVTRQSSANSPTQREVMASFRSNASLVELGVDGNQEFYLAIDSLLFSCHKKKPPGRPGVFQSCVKLAIGVLRSKLLYMKDYEPHFLTDDAMGINDVGLEGAVVSLDSGDRAYYRYKFREQLKNGLDSIPINVFGLVNGGNNPSCIFVWKVPRVNGKKHTGNVQQAIALAKEAAPKHMSIESIKAFNNCMNQISDVPVKIRNALRNYLCMGDVNSDGKTAEAYCQFVMDISNGLPVDESLIIDKRSSNSRGGGHFGVTMYEPFWEECRQILLPSCATEERRHGDTLHASVVNSISGLVKEVTASLQRKVDAGQFAIIPPIPSDEWVRLQFVPSNDYREMASRFTGRLKIRHAMQTRSLRKIHVDQHWVNAYTRYYLEWMVELKTIYDGVEFFGQDDKAKIPVGDEVPVSTGVRASTRSIVAIDDTTALKAMDHDFHVGNIIPSVTLRCNIPNAISGSFFSGGKDGFGEIFVTFRDAVFDPSEVFDHCAQLLDTLKRKEISPAVIVLQTDGGPDHSLKRLATKMAMIAVFKSTNCDHLVSLRGAPNGSAVNKIERAMSPMNNGLSNVSLQRIQMPDWAEEAVKNRGSMSEIRNAAGTIDSMREKAIKRLARWRRVKANRLTLRRLNVLFAVLGDNESAAKVVAIVMEFHGAKLDSQPEGSTISAVIELEDGVEIAHSNTIPITVAASKHKNALEISTRDLRLEWASAIANPIAIVSRKVSQVQVDGRNIVVTSRVERQCVDNLYAELKAIDSSYSHKIRLAEHLKNIPLLKSFMDTHVVLTPYSLSITKCSDITCCGHFLSPMEDRIRKLVMQRQPTPRTDPNRKGHFLRRVDALNLHGKDTKAYSNINDLPSKLQEDKKKSKSRRDEEISKSAGLKSWDAKKVRCFVACFHCSKRRCIFSPKNDEYHAAKQALRQKLESVGHRFSCGDLVFDDSDHLSTVLVQRQNITCESPMEKAYYETVGRSLSFVDVCYCCGDSGGKGYLLTTSDLEERNLTGGSECFPICIVCLDAGEKVEKKSKRKKQSQSIKEKSAKRTKGN